MRSFPLVSSFFCLAVSLSISPLWAGDTEDLKAAFDSALEALENKDSGRFVEHWHPEAVLLSRNRIHPIDRAELDDREWAHLFEDLFGRIISAGYTKSAVHFRVIGQTGLAWGLTRLAVDTRGGEGFDQQSRLTAVFSKHEGAWKIILWNDSPLPTGRTPMIQ